MFDTCEWIEEGDGRTTSPGTTEKTKASARDKVNTSRKKRLKRNRQLLEVLRTLSAPSTLHPDLPTPPDATTPKKRKKMAPGVSLPEDTPRTPRPPISDEQLSRQQWRNKVKNKRRNRNKFKLLTGGAAEGRQGSTGGGAAEGREGSTGGGAAEGRQGSSGGGAAEGREGSTGGGVAEASAAQDGGPQRQGGKKLKSQQSRGKRNGVTSGKGGEETLCPGRSSAGNQVPRSRLLPVGERRTSGGGVLPSHPTVHKQQVTPQDRARLQKLRKIMQRETTETPSEEDPNRAKSKGEQPEVDNSVAIKDRSAELRSRMEQRLNSARFRYINQQLYESDSQDAANLFKQDPEAFTIYHGGFSQQVQHWPVNPITEIIKYIKHRPSSLEVADFGCGDALLARSVRNRVHSFDLVALNEHVTVCNMAKVPLLDASVDVAVFCLSLMGKNLSDFLQEANRVLKPDGVLLVAEVSSRFDDVRQFLGAMSQLGFKSVNKYTENSHFFLFEFSKTGRARDAANHPGLQLKPCLYKKR